ncbi:hypothetical protein SAMN05216308_11648 [Nitrosospira sp. Nsp13]|nr:hypothetical protein SAMN05216308_11648 [Nitrosospira sp. Nsp13]
MAKFYISTFTGMFLLFFSQGNHSETIMPDKNEEITIKCECLISDTACEFEVFANMHGKPLQTWYQEGTLTAGVSADLNAACYRKRDVSGMGEGLCCTTSDVTKTISNLFRGTRQ